MTLVLAALLVALFAQELPPPPQIDAPANVVLANDPGRCSASGLILGVPAARDFAGGHAITASRGDGLPMSDPFPRGDTVIFWTVTDAAGQTATANQYIKVNDTEPPKIEAPPDIEMTTNDGCFAADVNEGEPVITENCPDSTLGVTAKDAFGREVNAEKHRYPAGITTLTWTLQERTGRGVSATQRIIVKPRNPPAIEAPSDVAAETDRGKCTAFVDVGKPVATDECGVNTITPTRSDGRRRVDMAFPVGRTTITWTATGPSGLTASAEQDVVVKDTEAPVIGDLRIDKSEIWPANDRMVGVKVSYNAADACGGPVTTSLSVTSNGPADWEIVNRHYVDLRAVPDRVYTIRVTAVDAAGNESVGTATVSVKPPKE